MPREIPKVKTPGVPTTESGETDADALMKGAPDLDDGSAQATEEQQVVVSASKLEAMIRRGVQTALDAQRSAGGKVKEVDLPDASEIDIDKIQRPTLSKQGYVVPRNYGMPRGLVGNKL